MSEVWKKINDKYSVSNFGNIEIRNWNNTDQTRLMSKRWRKDGYEDVILKIDGKNKCILVHRLVAEYFIPNPKKLPFINHLNFDRKDNRADNLEWCTRLQNNRYTITNGRKPKFYYTGNKITEKEALEIRAKFKPRVYTLKMLAAEYGLCETHISEIIHKKVWKHV